ncbi:MAG TPA: hypothetical protein VFA94_04210 [Acidimicrobiales bacterium]|nr:hypothetical protein [Acidimicrobiales bacterium]
MHERGGAGRLARLYCLARMGLGASVLAAPSGARVWLGDDVDRPVVQWLSRSLGIRDLVIGLGGYRALRRGEDAGPWLRAAAATDAMDAAAAALVVKRLPKPGGALMVGAAAAGAAVGFALAGRGGRSPAAR